jgi:hypothetical protein
MPLIENRPFYQAGFFAPHGVTPTPETIAKLISAFSEFEFLPTTIQALQLGGAPASVPTLQLQLFSQDRRWTIDFEPHRFLIQQHMIQQTPLDPPQTFTERVFRFIHLLHELYPYSATRLSFVTRGLCREMSSAELDFVHGSLFTLPSVMSDTKPVEWSTRQVIRVDRSIADRPETLNVVTDIGRVQGVLSGGQESVPFDRIQIALDINTHQGNQAQRFTPDQVVPFLNAAFALQTEVEQGVEELVYA